MSADVNTEVAPRSLLAGLDAQPRVREFLARAVDRDRTSHAYLFVGASGSGKLDAAWALAQRIICPDDGCGACDACVRVARHTHPDVHYLSPESATGYLISQTRALLEDVALAPIRAAGKVYIIDNAEQLRANTANALLKTLEEPPRGVTFILLGTSTDVILPTIVSRCQCVPFRLVSPARAAVMVAKKTGTTDAKCRIAVAVAGSPARAVEFLKSAERQAARREILRQLDLLPRADEADVLLSSKSLLAAIKAPLRNMAQEQADLLEPNREILTRGAIKQIEDRNKRELNARERSGIMEALAAVRSVLRDVLLSLEDPSYQIVNEDSSEMVARLMERLTPARALDALDAVSTCEARIRRNVTPQLAIETMLFDIRKALLCP